MGTFVEFLRQFCKTTMQINILSACHWMFCCLCSRISSPVMTMLLISCYIKNTASQPALNNQFNQSKTTSGLYYFKFQKPRVSLTTWWSWERPGSDGFPSCRSPHNCLDSEAKLIGFGSCRTVSVSTANTSPSSGFFSKAKLNTKIKFQAEGCEGQTHHVLCCFSKHAGILLHA